MGSASVDMSNWSIEQNGTAHFNNIVSTGTTINGNATINGDATINGNLSVTGLISNKGILPANYEFNNKRNNIKSNNCSTLYTSDRT